MTYVYLMELFSMGHRYQFISTPPVILLITRGTQLFVVVVVGRDVRGGSPNWPGRVFVFRGGYHPPKTSPGKHHVNQQWVHAGWLVPS